MKDTIKEKSVVHSSKDLIILSVILVLLNALLYKGIKIEGIILFTRVSQVIFAMSIILSIISLIIVLNKCTKKNVCNLLCQVNLNSLLFLLYLNGIILFNPVNRNVQVLLIGNFILIEVILLGRVFINTKKIDKLTMKDIKNDMIISLGITITIFLLSLNIQGNFEYGELVFIIIFTLTSLCGLVFVVYNYSGLSIISRKRVV